MDNAVGRRWARWGDAGVGKGIRRRNTRLGMDRKAAEDDYGAPPTELADIVRKGRGELQRAACTRGSGNELLS